MNGPPGGIEIMQRSKLWRLLTGDERYDTDYWLTRLENKLDCDLGGRDPDSAASHAFQAGPHPQAKPQNSPKNWKGRGGMFAAGDGAKG